jgi:chromosomal replication initiation ATPase DnaA
MHATDRDAGIWRLSLEHIESRVSTQLGPGRVPGNRQASCFSRQISMYLAKHVAGWSTVKIGRFYNGRHHTTVLHAIQKVHRLRAEDEAMDALIEVLTAVLREDVAAPQVRNARTAWPEELIEAITTRVLHRLRELESEIADLPRRRPRHNRSYSWQGGRGTFQPLL